ncbi:hypothetical protein SU32_06250 [Ahrensia marina]|uniref:Uncharacterized protein n=1 Tax=Ahrensia marina TaxID=1514904 RepID=A0A0N0E851_9HYPH|nr:hypothetical protein SU32_06250 [Ahrensia marina]
MRHPICATMGVIETNSAFSAAILYTNPKKWRNKGGHRPLNIQYKALRNGNLNYNIARSCEKARSDFS